MRSLVGHAGGPRVRHGACVTRALEVAQNWQIIAGKRPAHPQPSRTIGNPTIYFLTLLLAAVAAVAWLITPSLKTSTVCGSHGTTSVAHEALSCCDSRVRYVCACRANSRILRSSYFHAEGQDDRTSAPFLGIKKKYLRRQKLAAAVQQQRSATNAWQNIGFCDSPRCFILCSSYVCADSAQEIRYCMFTYPPTILKSSTRRRRPSFCHTAVPPGTLSILYNSSAVNRDA